MICPGCKYSSDAAEVCPECGREFAGSGRLAHDRDTFVRRLIACHTPWLILGLAFLVAAIWFGDPTVLFSCKLFLGVANVGIIVEVPLLYTRQLKLDASSEVRDLWCLLVLASGIAIAVILVLLLLIIMNL